MIQSLRNALLGLLFAVGCCSCSGAAPEVHAPSPPPAPTASAPAPAPLPPGIDETALDRSTPPCKDFYQYACGGWLKTTAIPEEESSWTRSFDVVQERNENLLHDILDAYAKGQASGEPYAKELGDFYAACMNEDAVEKAGAAPLTPFIKRIDALKTPKDLADITAELHRAGIPVLFGFDSAQDHKNASEVIGSVAQGGLGLPDRDYYLTDEPKMKEVLGKYEDHVARMLALTGKREADAKNDARLVIGLERALADASLSSVDLRDPHKVYHRIDRKGLVNVAPRFPWAIYFARIGAGSVEAMNVAEPDFVQRIDALMDAAPQPAPCDKNDKACAKGARGFPAASFRAYLRFHLASGMAGALSKGFVDESFRLVNLLTGAEKLMPRWKRCVRATDEAIGDALGRPFVKKTLSDRDKAIAHGMVSSIEAAMSKNLDRIRWMDEPTRVHAHEKLKAIANKIAFPEKWRSYAGLAVDRNDTFGNRVRANAFDLARHIAKIGKPLDRLDWDTTPPTVNAYYEASLNEIVFPAGILQPPFYSSVSARAVNFGAIGSVEGHELTHGFDDEGRQFDAGGNLKEWWSDTARAEFERRAACVEDQFENYVVLGDVHLSGKLTLGENIADLGGLRLAFAAMKADAERAPHETSSKTGDAMPPEQQFFLGFAQQWCTVIRDEALQLAAQTDPHAPARFRVNGPLSNMSEFAEAFSCEKGAAMRRADACEVW